MYEKLLSIIIPVYNLGGESSLLPRCIKSILHQIEGLPIELIVVNDGSNDNSENIILNLKQNNTQIKYLRKENGGVGSARNIGLDHCDSKYISFLDGDDFVCEDYIESILPFLNNKKFELLCFNYFKTSNTESRIDLQMKDQIIHLEPHDGLRRFLNFEFQEIIRPFVWNKVFPNEIIQKHNLRFDEKKKIGEDTLFTISYLEKISNITMLEKPLYHYFERDGSVMRTYNNFHASDSLQYVESFKNIAAENNYAISEHEIMAFLLSRWFGLINNESKSGDFKKGKQNLYYFINSSEFKNNLNKLDMTKLNIKLKVYYILNKLHFSTFIYLIMYIKNSVI